MLVKNIFCIFNLNVTETFFLKLTYNFHLKLEKFPNLALKMANETCLTTSLTIEFVIPSVIEKIFAYLKIKYLKYL